MDYMYQGDTYEKNTNKRRKSYNDEYTIPVRQRSQANARERDRTQSVNTAFSTLRTLIPTEPKDRKLSKIETLRLASSYISHLGTQLMAGPIDQPCLRLPKSVVEEDPIGPNRNQVCTFCIAHKKSPKSLLMDDYECQNLQNQLFTNNLQSSSNTNIYYQ